MATTAPVDKTKPDFKSKFNGPAVKTIIKQVLAEKLQDAKYSQDASPEQSQKIADEIKRRCKALNLPRYKYMVHVVIGEQRGEGVRMGCRCLWDQNTDNYASDTFVNVRQVRSFAVYMRVWWGGVPWGYSPRVLVWANMTSGLIRGRAPPGLRSGS